MIDHYGYEQRSDATHTWPYCGDHVMEIGGDRHGPVCGWSPPSGRRPGMLDIHVGGGVWWSARWDEVEVIAERFEYRWRKIRMARSHSYGQSADMSALTEKGEKCSIH